MSVCLLQTRQTLNKKINNNAKQISAQPWQHIILYSILSRACLLLVHKFSIKCAPEESQRRRRQFVVTLRAPLGLCGGKNANHDPVLSLPL